MKVALVYNNKVETLAVVRALEKLLEARKIEIDTENSPSYSFASMQTEEIIDIKQYEDDKNSSSGEI